MTQAGKRYGVLIADPAWSYVNAGARLRGTVGENQYTTMTTQDICELPVRQLASDDSVLFLWATFPKLPDAFMVMEAWGFEYLTGVPWLKVEAGLVSTKDGDLYMKPQYGVGFWFRGCAELLLLGRRGTVSPWDDAPVGIAPGSHLGLASENWGHSRKPDNLHEWAEKLTGPYLELFARRRWNEKWDVWGSEAPDSIMLADTPAPEPLVDQQQSLFE